jgi:3',5'-cyclic AMP phosphodiesterase CpdA
MRTIVHLSDIHFGQVDYLTIAPLLDAVRQVRPDLVAVSGDLTQRAKGEQFQEAREFLDALPSPKIIVPGNHDIPLYNLFNRFLRPLDNYQRYITDNLQPFYLDEEIAVIGINTARSLTVKGGRINRAQLAMIRERMCSLDDHVTRVVVTHHPFDSLEGQNAKNLIGRARLIMEALMNCGIDLFLAGHLHFTNMTSSRYRFAGNTSIVIQAGTATSTRSRGETNSFNVLQIERPYVTVEHLSLDPDRGIFTVSKRKQFCHTPYGWY